MPGITSASRFVIQHDSASNFLSFTFPALLHHEASSNIILAHALKRVNAEDTMTGIQFTRESDVQGRIIAAPASLFSAHENEGSFWLTLWTKEASSPHATLDLVLSCVDWTLGKYPIFLWTPTPQNAHNLRWLGPRIAQIADHLHGCVPPERVYSVFGLALLVKQFTAHWTTITNFGVESTPFYAAYFSYCDRVTFKRSESVLPPGHELRRASLGDLEPAAQLCKEFADDSVYFPLDLNKARTEAQELISKGQLWVYVADGEISTICAVTRNTHTVSAITKVYTTPKWRRRGCAEFLVRDVTAQLLFEFGKNNVVLYVGHENSAQYVYDRVGFQGLGGNEKTARIEDSLELGFKNTNRGHW